MHSHYCLNGCAFWTSGTGANFHICASCLSAERCGSCSCQPCTAHAFAPNSHICGEHIFWMVHFHRKVPHLFPAKIHFNLLIPLLPRPQTLNQMHGRPSLILNNHVDLSLWSLNEQAQVAWSISFLTVLFSTGLILNPYDNTINVQICSKKERLHVLLSLLERDAPKSVIIFVAQQVLI
jgi:hypothetical protein